MKNPIMMYGNVVFERKYRAARTAVMGTEISPLINIRPFTPKEDLMRASFRFFQVKSRDGFLRLRCIHLKKRSPR